MQVACLGFAQVDARYQGVCGAAVGYATEGARDTDGLALQPMLLLGEGVAAYRQADAGQGDDQVDAMQAKWV